VEYSGLTLGNKLKVISPPDEYCFYQSLIQFIRFEGKNNEENYDQFVELATLFKLKGSAFESVKNISKFM